MSRSAVSVARSGPPSWTSASAQFGCAAAVHAHSWQLDAPEHDDDEGAASSEPIDFCAVRQDTSLEGLCACWMAHLDTVEPGSKVDEHIDVNEVERVFTTAFAGDFARLDCQHEVLASSPAVVDAVLDAMRAALDQANRSIVYYVDADTTERVFDPQALTPRYAQSWKELPWMWAPQHGVNMWKTWNDIKDTWYTYPCTGASRCCARRVALLG